MSHIALKNMAGSVPANGSRLAIVIDDEVLILEGLTLALEYLGWTVLAAETVEEIIRRLDHTPIRPSVIIADYRLKGGRTGVEAIQRLHAAVGDPTVPALLLTGDTFPERLREASLSGFTLLYKPVTWDELSARLHEAQPA